MSGEVNTPQHSYGWMPTAAGILSVIAGAIGLVVSIYFLVFGNILGAAVIREFLPASWWQVWGWPLVVVGLLAIPFIIIDIISIIGGVYAIQRKKWPLAMTGAICAIFASRPLGILAVIFTVLSRKEFE